MSRIIVRNTTKDKELIWYHIRIRKSLDDICHTLELQLPASERAKVNCHDKIEVRYENPLVRDSGGRRRVTTVLVDEIITRADCGSYSLTLSGRSPARDIIDSTWGGGEEGGADGELTGMTLREILKHIGSRFGITCDTFPEGKPDPTSTVPAFNWENESPWDKLLCEAEAQHYILTSNEAGNLLLWKTASAVRSEGFKVTEGKNIRSINLTENGADQYHCYVIRGSAQPAITLLDKSCKNNRIFTINMTDPDIDKERMTSRGQTEMRRRGARRLEIGVPGWGLTDTQIKALGETDKKEIFWIPNALIPVSIHSLGLEDTMLIASVEYEASAQEAQSTLTLADRETYL